MSRRVGKHAWRILGLVLATVALSFAAVPVAIDAAGGSTSIGSASLTITPVGKAIPGSLKVDVQVQLLSNGTPVASGVVRCVTVTANKAKTSVFTPVSVPLTSNSGGSISPTNLALQASVRIGTKSNGSECANGTTTASGVRLYYDSQAFPSGLNASLFSDTPQNYYLHSDGSACSFATPSAGVTTSWFDSYTPAATSADDAKCQTSGALTFAGNNPWATLGTFNFAQPALSLTKTAQQSDFSAVNQTLNYSYLVTNTGNVPLSSIGVTDNRMVTGLSCPQSSLVVGANETCTSNYTTTASDMSDGQVTNIATAQGTAPLAPTATSSSPESLTVPTIGAPAPEAISVQELPLPPVISSSATGSCSLAVNPNDTGCIGSSTGLGAGGFMPDGTEVLATLRFIGAPAAPDPGSIYSGSQLVMVKTDGTLFSNGSSWKCLTCGIPSANKQGINSGANYINAFPDGTRILDGNNIISCGANLLASDACTPANTFIYPIFFNGPIGGASIVQGPREFVLSPDGIHVGFDEIYTAGSGFGEADFIGALSFDPTPATAPLVPRYDLTNVQNTLAPSNSSPFTVDPSNPSHLIWNPNAIAVGEIRGFSGDGKQVTYIGNPVESDNVDVFGADMTTGAVTRISGGQQYVDPMNESPNNWSVDLGVLASGRMNFVSAMRDVPPLNDLVTVSAVSSIRNNGGRRFFQPVLFDPYGGRGNYHGQMVDDCTMGPCSTDATGPGGAANDFNWNTVADPAFSPDGMNIAYVQSLTTSPACGGSNPLTCETSTEPGGRTARLMLATLTSRTPLPTPRAATPSVGDSIPWAQPFTPGESVSNFTHPFVPTGTYTLNGLVSGSAQVTVTAGSSSDSFVSATYTNYSNDGDHVLNGSESVQAITGRPGQNAFTSIDDWTSNLTETDGQGNLIGTKVTTGDPNYTNFPTGFEIQINVLTNNFFAEGTLSTTINGTTYTQPANGQ
jgi:hypothetical protein